jgi:copper chaperone
METTSFNVPSITCNVCSSKIEQGVKGLKGVSNVSIDLKSQMVKVDYNPSEVTPQDIKRQVSSMGYEVI